MAETKLSYRFGEFRLDPEAASLRRGEAELGLPPKGLLVLTYLIEHRQRVVPKQELVEAIWKDTFVTDDALVQVVTAIRRALGDDPEKPRYLRTRPRVGYQFIAAVEAQLPAAVGGPAAAPMSVWKAPIVRDRARWLMLLIQAGYIGLYTLTLVYLGDASSNLGAALLGRFQLEGAAVPLLVVLTLTGMAVRLYLITTLALDHPQTGRQYRRLLPALFTLDLAWALAPLLLTEATGLAVALLLIPALVYAPFAQATLVRSAYAVPSAGR